MGAYSFPPLAPAESSIGEQSHPFERGGTSLEMDLPAPLVIEPLTNVVSLRKLQHPTPKKALREALEAQQLALAKNSFKAIAKLEDAIRIDPEYRDAHLNLGTLYARTGRMADARAEFQKALDIGPPWAPIYADLALASVALHQYREAETFAHKALKMESTNRGAKLALQFASQH